MKTKITFLLLSLLSLGLSAQNNLELHKLYSQAKENHPLQKQSDLFQKQNNINNSLIEKNFYPKFDLNAQATFQSDVTEINIPIPSITMPEIKKDQYKINVDASQLIYDGGINKSMQNLENMKTLAQISGVEIEIYSLYAQINNAFFGIMFIDENQKALDENQKEIDKRIETANFAVENGVLIKSKLDKLNAAKLRLNEKNIELEYNRKHLLKTISKLTGVEYSPDIKIIYPVINNYLGDEFLRPEHELFENQKKINAEQINLQQKTRKPKIFAFGQAGYGRPGYNMFADGFDDYYMVGVKLNWNIVDWGQTKQRKEVIAINQEIIENQKLNLNRNLDIATEKHLNELEKIEMLILNETKIVAMQNNILNRTSAKLDNGTITTTEYLSDLNEYSQAVIRLNSLNIRKQKTQIDMQIVTGQISRN